MRFGPVPPATLAGIWDDPALVHCTTGKDRTGWAAAIALLACGVDPETVMADYLQTNDQLLPLLAPMLERYEQAGGDPELLKPLIGVAPEYLTAALSAVNAEFGSMAGYLQSGLGLQDGQLAQLADRLVAG